MSARLSGRCVRRYQILRDVIESGSESSSASRVLRIAVPLLLCGRAERSPTFAMEERVDQLNPSRRVNWSSLVAAHCQLRPSATAVRCDDREISWSELDERVSRAASWMRWNGVGVGDRIAVLTYNIPEFIEVAVAVARVGAILVPINFRLSGAELEQILADCAPVMIFVEDSLATLVPASWQKKLRVVAIASGGHPVANSLAYEVVLASGRPLQVLDDVDDNAVGFIMYTSGTTGRPKGAMLTHLNIFVQGITTMRAMRLDDENDVVLVATPLFHIAAFANLAPAMITGATTLVYPVGEFDAAKLVDSLQRHKVTHVFLVPAQWISVVNEPTLKQRELAVRTTAWGAAPATTALLTRMSETFPTALNVAVFGQTEMSPVTCVLKGEDALRKLGSVGRPVSYVQVRVVDSNMYDVAPGEVGEIVYRGPNMFSGYWNSPAATEAAFADGWFHSGDLVRRDDEGFVYVVDRLKDMIISGGENIYCAEVENALAAHPSVRDVAVVGRPDERWGEVPVAFIVLQPDAALPELAGLRIWLSERLAKYKHPKELRAIETLPRNASGKVNKAELRSIA